MSQFSALSKSFKGLARVIVTECGISEAFTIFEMQQNLPHPRVAQFNAVWDTGAWASAISPRYVPALLKSSSEIRQATYISIVS